MNFEINYIHMKSDIILSGVGGQGILSIAAAIGLAAIDSGLNMKQAEVHGMSQRGGAVQSHLRLSSEEIASDLIPYGEADIILSVEPMESLRYLPYLSEKGWLVSNSIPFVNIPGYPDVKEIHEQIEKITNHVLLDADHIAKETGSSRSLNMVMLGAASHFIPISMEGFIQSVKNIFSRKGEEIIELNINAFRQGRTEASKYIG